MSAILYAILFLFLLSNVWFHSCTQTVDIRNWLLALFYENQHDKFWLNNGHVIHNWHGKQFMHKSFAVYLFWHGTKDWGSTPNIFCFYSERVQKANINQFDSAKHYLIPQLYSDTKESPFRKDFPISYGKTTFTSANGRLFIPQQRNLKTFISTLGTSIAPKEISAKSLLGCDG